MVSMACGFFHHRWEGRNLYDLAPQIFPVMFCGRVKEEKLNIWLRCPSSLHQAKH